MGQSREYQAVYYSLLTSCDYNTIVIADTPSYSSTYVGDPLLGGAAGTVRWHVFCQLGQFFITWATYRCLLVDKLLSNSKTIRATE